MPIVTVSGGADIDYERAGSGRDMLLLHSLLTDRHAFDDVVPLLAPHRRLTLLNLPGFGRSSPAGPAIEDYADRVAAAFPALGLPPATDVVAMSFGGFVGSALASRHGRLFDRLVLVDTAAAFPEPAKVPLRAMAERAEREGMAAVLEVAVRRIFTETFIAAHPDIVEARKATLLRADTGPFAIACRALAALDLRPVLARIANPTLVVVGALDITTPPALARELAEGIPNARLVEIPDCAHCPPIERPREFVATLRDFLGLPG